MININYDTHIPVGKKVKLSGILHDNHYSYGIFDEDMYLASIGMIPMDQHATFIHGLERSHKLSEQKNCSLSDLFIHVPTKDSPVTSDHNKLEHFFDEGIAIVYDVKFNSGLDTRHFSNLINKYYFGKLGTVMHLHFLERKFFIYIADDGQMLFYNQFDIENEADVAYFTNLAMQSLFMEEAKLNIVLSGLIDIKSAMHNVLTMYFSNISFAEIQGMKLLNDDRFKVSYYFDHYINMTHQ